MESPDQDNLAAPAHWVCPRCGYSLAGLRDVECPECGRVTTEAEQREIARRREMPRTLARIAQVGVVFDLMVWGWAVVGVLLSLQRGGARRPGTETLEGFIAALIISSVAFPGCCWVYRNLSRIHRRSETSSWIAAHATWLPALGAVAILRFTAT